jgi:hypothetical protein
MLKRYPYLDGESSIYNLKKLNRKNYKFNPKLLIRKKQLSFEIITMYIKHLTNNFFLCKEGIKNFLTYINYKDEFNIKFIPWLFFLIVKSKMINNLKRVLELNNNLDELTKIKIQEIINDNWCFLYFDEIFFKNC